MPEERSQPMPQLVKGGKYTFGWSRVGETGRIIIPPEALEEYHLKEFEKLILVPGSRTSGGFGLGAQEAVRKSPLGIVVDSHPGFEKCRLPEGKIVEYKGRPYCWVELKNGGIAVPPGTLEKYGIRIGDLLLVIRGSSLAIGFAVRGPIVDRARKYPELEIFEPEIRKNEPP
jgi:bifunctional DNA-binding transcriptional regulator/antitoxin component of YhaV-PrlF toxin-antitoxin module